MSISKPELAPKSGYVEVELEGSRYYKNIETGKLFKYDMTPLIAYTPAELREQAYRNMKAIEFEDNLYTVDEAEKLFWQYFPDASKEKVANLLKKLISEAKDYIRKMYPDN